MTGLRKTIGALPRHATAIPVDAEFEAEISGVSKKVSFAALRGAALPDGLPDLDSVNNAIDGLSSEIGVLQGLVGTIQTVELIADAVEEARLNSVQQRGLAETMAAASEAARNISVDARVASEAARNVSIDARNVAEAARLQSQQARDAALGYSNSANQAFQNAETARSNAVTAATAAAGSASTAAGYATTFETQVDEAAESAAIATGSAAVATTRAAQATASAGQAAQSATNAQGFSASAASSSNVSVQARDTALGYRNDAAASAAASSSSASTASLAVTEATAQANSATNSRNVATTKAAEAVTSAGQAAQSRTDAQGFSASAAAASDLSVSARDLALGWRNDAATYAAASSASASSASISAGAASTQANAATTARNEAVTAAGRATSEAGNAVASASGAAASSTSAASFASLTASTYRDVSALEGNNQFTRGFEGWSVNVGGQGAGQLPSFASVQDGPWYTGSRMIVASPNLGMSLFSARFYDIDPSRKYEIKTRIGAYRNGTSGSTARFYVGFAAFNAAGEVIDHGAYGSYRYACVTGEVLTDGQIVDQSQIVTGSGNDSWQKFPPGTTKIRLLALMNESVGVGLADGNVFTYLDYLTWEDVTAREQANGYANASATSASQAQTSQTAAGNSATAANSARIAAEAANGSAQSSASAASSSAAAAGASQSSAVSSASLAASFSDQAASALAANFPRQIAKSSFTYDFYGLNATSTPPDTEFTNNSRIYTNYTDTSPYGYGIWLRTVVPYQAGRTYTLNWNWVHAIGPSTTYGMPYVVYFAADGSAVGQGTFGEIVVTPISFYADRAFNHTHAGAPAGTAFVRYGVLCNRQASLQVLSGTATSFRSCYLVDATAQVAAETAAAASQNSYVLSDASRAASVTASTNSATFRDQAQSAAAASSSSANSASASQTAAGNSAAAANSARIAAEAANGSAQGSAAASQSSYVASDEARAASVTASNNSATFRDQAQSAASAALGYRNGAESQAGVATSQASAATAAAAAAQTSAVVSASIGLGSLNRNPTFSDTGNLTDSFSTANVPSDWVYWSSSYGLARVVGPYGGYGLRGAAATAESNEGVYSDVGTGALGMSLSGPAKLVLEAEWELEPGAQNKGAGLLLYGFDAGYSVINSAVLSFEAAKGTGTSGTIYRADTLVDFNAVNVRFLRLYAMTNYVDGFSAGGAAKTIRWYKASVRLATAEEIRSNSAIPALQASVTTNAAAVATVQGKTQAYFQVTAVAGDGRTQLSVIADGAGGGGVEIVGDLKISGNLLVGGTVNYAAMDLSSLVKKGSGARTGGAFTAPVGTTTLLEFNIGVTRPGGAYYVDYGLSVTTNAGRVGAFPNYTDYIADSPVRVQIIKNGAVLTDQIAQGSTIYFDADDGISAMTSVKFYIVQNNMDETINNGDFTVNRLSASNTINSLTAKAKWTFV